MLSPIGKQIGVRVAAFYGGTSMDRQIRNLSRKIEVAVATPGRLIDLLERGELDLDDIRILIIDEADRMADMGFLPQVEWIMRKVPNDRQTLLFSATLDREVDVLVRRYMRDPVLHEVVAEEQDVDEMLHRFLKVHELDRIKVLAAISEGVSRTLVFVRTKRGADKLVSQLKREGVAAAAIHGDLRQSAREKALRDFQEEEHGLLVATDVAAAASTSTTSTWSCTTTRPKSRSRTCTAPGAPPAPATRAWSSRSCCGTRSSRWSGCNAGSACGNRSSRCSRTIRVSPTSWRSTVRAPAQDRPGLNHGGRPPADRYHCRP